MGQFDHINLSPTDVFPGQHDYELFFLQKQIDAPYDKHSHQHTHVYEEQDQDVILTHATILSHTFALPQFMDQHNAKDLEPTDTPNTYQPLSKSPVITPLILGVLMTQWKSSAANYQYASFNHNFTLLQFMA